MGQESDELGRGYLFAHFLYATAGPFTDSLFFTYLFPRWIFLVS